MISVRAAALTNALRVFAPAAAAALLLLWGAQAPGQRSRVPLDDGWRFHKGDPPGADTRNLQYDRLPAARGEDQRAREAESTMEAAQLQADEHAFLKPWILPSGNRFLSDPSRQHTRPPGNPGGDLPYVSAAFNDAAWAPVRLPHDWAIAGPFTAEGSKGAVGGSMGRLPSPGVGWYRRKLALPPDAEGKRIALEVDGAMSYAAVWVNGTLVGGWPYGYASWQLDLTPYLHAGEDNQLAIRLDNPPDFSRWYPGAGLYRHVWLLETSPVHVGQQGTYLATPSVTVNSAAVSLRVTLDNDSAVGAAVEVQTTLFVLGADGQPFGTAVATTPVSRVSVPARGHVDAEASATLPHPHLWGPPPTQKPNRYVALTTVRREGKVLDRYQTRFGIRKVEYRPDGLYVNGERIRIQGVDQHHDLGSLGAAWNGGAAERQLDLLQRMGANAIRMAHNPPAPELLEMTDSRGILVMDEIFDCWLRQKTPFDFHLIFADWHEQDVRSFVRRDRNHPSVVLWSVGNEVGEQGTGEAGAAIARELIALAHEEDPTRPATASMNFAKAGSPFASALDVIALNYQGEGIRDTPEYAAFKGLKTLPQYDGFHSSYPGKMIVSSESAAALSSRDDYQFPVAPGVSNPARNGLGEDQRTQQVSAYELYAADFGSSADKVFNAQDRHPFVAGEFVWTGWDYLGEPTPFYSSRSSYFGIIDLAGFPKDRFYLYQSRWRPELAMAHILPHWTWPDRVGKVTPVHVFTSGDEAELFLNGRSLGRKKKGASDYRLRWDDVVYEPGVLKVVAYRKGRPWATDEVRTASAPAQLQLAAERASPFADGADLAFLTVTVADASGITVPQADLRVHFELDGPGEIVTTDNGDPTDLEPFPSHDRRVFHGKCLLVVRSLPGGRGEMHVRASAQGLGEATLRVTAGNGAP